MTDWVFRFGFGAEGGKDVCSDLLGGKGANLTEMASIGLPIPPGFVISTTVCQSYQNNHGSYPAGVHKQVVQTLSQLEAALQTGFGDQSNPLLLSVRSGASVSMPGMMDTVLNLGLNDLTVAGLALISGDERFAWDSYRRFIQMYSNVVLNMDHTLFETALDAAKVKAGNCLDSELTASQIKSVVTDYLAIVEAHSGSKFPQNVNVQLWGAIGAVFASWHSDRAKVYRRINNIPDELGTAVTIQAMVFGNKGQTSATGVAFTRDPSTGESGIFGEFLVNAQGEDVVAGIRTPHHLTKAARVRAKASDLSMEELMPDAYAALHQACTQLEAHYCDMQDIEFTVEQGRLWLLQTRAGKRTARAGIKIAVSMVDEGIIDQATAVIRQDANSLNQLLHPSLDPNVPRKAIVAGLSASPGAATGRIVFDADTAEEYCARGEAVILVRVETSPEDIHGMHAAKGILTVRGGMTSHAAVVARGMGRPCVSGVSELKVDEAAKTMRAGGQDYAEGEFITIDGSTGEVFLGCVPTVEAEFSPEFERLMVWADNFRRMRVRANADSPEDAEVARSFGAEGIGLCRTEHMFFEPGRIAAVREMILASDESERRIALAKLLPEQREDFRQIFEVMAGFPVTIRLLDPPLHEFLPQSEAEFEDLAISSGLEVSRLKQRANELCEFNPMLGHRGCRLAVTFPEIYEMQARAIFEAACDVPTATQPEIMVPLTVSKRELAAMKQLIDATAQAVFSERGCEIKYLVGSMIELPRAALRAGDLAEVGSFFSFGTNDLTQTTFGMSRDDAAPFLAEYLRRDLLKRDPFVNLDVEGVGELMALAVERALKTNPAVKLGVCGEHGGDPYSIEACEDLGLDYVSASPFRIPVARLASAQATLARHPITVGSV